MISAPHTPQPMRLRLLLLGVLRCGVALLALSLTLATCEATAAQEQQQQQRHQLAGLGGERRAADVSARRRTHASPQPEMAAFYQAHSHPAAVNASLSFFRSFYPDAEIFLVNDGGLKSIQAIAEHYGAKYMYAPRVDDATTRSAHRKPLIFTSALAAVTWLSHLLQALGDARWLLNLEDDVLVLRPIDAASLLHDQNGAEPRLQLPEFVRSAVQGLGDGGAGQRARWGYNGCGGTVFRGDFFRQLARERPWVEQVREVFAGLPEGGALGADQVVTALVYANGGTVGSFPGYAEMWNPDLERHIAAGKVSVLHQAKLLYNKPFSFQDLGPGKGG